MRSNISVAKCLGLVVVGLLEGILFQMSNWISDKYIVHKIFELEI